MPRPSIIPSVRAKLEHYLDGLEEQFQAQPESDRKPTLPSTSDGKVNVRAIAAAIELRQTQEKYLFEREELTSLINLVAEGQGLLPIGARNLDAIDKAVRTRMAQQAKSARVDAQAAIEAKAAEKSLLEDLAAAVTEIEVLKAENMRLRSQLEMIHAGILVRVTE
jgi:hypothetical protein